MVQFTVKANYFKELLDVIKLISNEAIMRFTRDSVKINLLDPAGIAMLYIEVPAIAFIEYSVDREVVASFNIDKFKTLLKPVKDDCTFTIDDDVSTANITSKRVKFKTYLIAVDSDNARRLPSLEYTSSLTVARNEVRTCLETCLALDSEVYFYTDSHGAHFTSHSDTESITIDMLKDELEESEITCEGSYFDCQYIVNVLKGISADKVKFSIGSNYPLTISFKIMDDSVNCIFLQAPRIHEE